MKKWNLDILYTSFDDENLQKDLQQIDVLIEALTTYVKETLTTDQSDSNKILGYYKQTDKLSSMLDIIGNMGQLTYSVDTKNTDALKLIEKVESLSPALTVNSVIFKKWLKTINNLEALISSDEALLAYKYVILEEKDESKYMLSDAEESLLASMKNTGSNAWNKLQDATISSLTADYEGKKTPITVIRNYAYDADSEKRKKAYGIELEALGSIASISASALNAVKGEVITVANKRGYTSPLEMTLKSSRMDSETLDAMMTAIKEYLPSFRAYMKKKAHMLGHKNGLPFYDLFAPVGDVNLTYTYDEARQFVIDNFTAYSNKLGQYATTAFDDDWIDPFPREGKVAGAFCSNIHAIKQSRIMSNFTGSLNDVGTLAHELGHGYHGDCLKEVLPANSDYPMPLAETASIFCETIVTNAALKSATDAEKLVIIEDSIMSANQVIVDIYSRFLFESSLFEGRKDASMSVDELKDAMLNAQKEAYGDGLNQDFLHPYMWVCKPHYYYADYNYYNFPYAFGLLFAKGLYAKYKEEGDAFLPKYDALLKSTGDNNIKDVLSIVGVDAHNPDFFRASLALIKKDIDFFLNH